MRDLTFPHTFGLDSLSSPRYLSSTLASSSSEVIQTSHLCKRTLYSDLSAGTESHSGTVSQVRKWASNSVDCASVWVHIPQARQPTTFVLFSSSYFPRVLPVSALTPIADAKEKKTD
ncbi:hypothetical protein H2248_007523 [Termitomyces sp. 'cryptogamus']|nr:hypothetical protein H2248_007523 [Termitomyces sp. 'cryptogamus']